MLLQELPRIGRGVVLVLEVGGDEVVGEGVGDPRRQLRVGAVEGDLHQPGIPHRQDPEARLQQPGHGVFARLIAAGGAVRRARLAARAHLGEEGIVVDEARGLGDAVGQRTALQQGVLGLEEFAALGELIAGLDVLHVDHLGGFAVDLEGGGGGIGGTGQQGDGGPHGKSRHDADQDDPLVLEGDLQIVEQAEPGFTLDPLGPAFFPGRQIMVVGPGQSSGDDRQGRARAIRWVIAEHGSKIPNHDCAGECQRARVRRATSGRLFMSEFHADFDDDPSMTTTSSPLITGSMERPSRMVT